MKEIEIVNMKQFQDVAQYLPDNIVVTFVVTENGVKLLLDEEVYQKAQAEYYADNYIFET